MRLYFKEQQKFNQWWLWVPMILFALFILYGLYQQVILGHSFGDHPLSNSGLVGFLVFVMALMLFFWSIKMTTEINEESIRIRYFPFSSRIIKWQEIKSAKVLNYGFVGGWGIRFKTKFGTVYNTRGNLGLALELTNGKKLCIGTQKVDEMISVINQARKELKL